jgi:hypothetical protein
MVHRTRPDDFIVRFSHHEDLELVLGTPWPGERHSHCGGGGGTASFVSMKGVPSHLRSSEVAQAILGSAGVKAEIAGDDALADPDDEQEMFVAAWCAHPNLIPDEMIIAMPESKDEHDGGSPLYLRPHEIIHDEVPALRYLIRIHPASRVSRLAYSAAFI